MMYAIQNFKFIESAVDSVRKRKIKVFIDAGHGGHDGGAQGAKSKESANVLAVALYLDRFLIAQGYEVKLSRRTDVYLTLSERAKLANALGADIFISLHDNSAKNKSATGFETFIFNTFKTTASMQRAVKLQNSVHDAILKEIGIRDRGKKRANFAVLRETNMTGLLIEYAFISNVNDEKILINEVAKQAYLTFKGINAFYGVVMPSFNKPAEEEKQMSVELNDVGRAEIRATLKKAREKGVIDKNFHTDEKIDKYNDGELLSYQAAVVNRVLL